MGASKQEFAITPYFIVQLCLERVDKKKKIRDINAGSNGAWITEWSNDVRREQVVGFFFSIDTTSQRVVYLDSTALLFQLPIITEKKKMNHLRQQSYCFIRPKSIYNLFIVITEKDEAQEASMNPHFSLIPEWFFGKEVDRSEASWRQVTVHEMEV